MATARHRMTITTAAVMGMTAIAAGIARPLGF